AGPLLRILFRPWVRGLDNLPTEGPAIIAGNHNHFMDSIFVPLLAPRPVVYLAKKDYFTGRGLKGAVTRWFFKLNNQLPMDRVGAANCLCGAPKAARRPVVKVHLGRRGAPPLVPEREAPVVPGALVAADRLLRAGGLVARPRRLGVVVRPHLDVSKCAGLPSD